MCGYNLEEVKRSREDWNLRVDNYERWYETFEGVVSTHLGLTLLRKYLPENKNARILDAAGGTGRITLPLAKMGYEVTLCDFSPGVLKAAKKKLLREGVYDKAIILECDIRNLNFPDEIFDFVLCWDGGIEAAKELIRVTKKGGRISVHLVNKWSFAIDGFYEHPDSTLASIESTPSYVVHHDVHCRAVSPEEARIFFEEEGIRVLDICAVSGWVDVLRIPEKILSSRNWDEKFFKQTTEMVLKLSKEPSVKGMTRHLVLYGEKT